MQYQFLRLNDRDEVARVIVEDCLDDRAALIRAQRLYFDGRVEIWYCNRVLTAPRPVSHFGGC